MSASYELAWEHRHHAGAIAAARFSPDGMLVATASADCTAVLAPVGECAPSAGRALNMTSPTALAVLRGHTGGLCDVAWSLDGALLATGGDDARLRLWSAATAAPACAPLAGHTAAVLALDWSPRGSLLASGSADESVRLWDPRMSAAVRVIPAHSEPVAALHFNADGTLLATGSYDGLIRLWDVASGHCLATLQLGDRVTLAPISGVRFSPNSRYLLASSLDGRLRLWDFLLGKPLKSYSGHSNLALCCAMAFSAPLSASEEDVPQQAAAAARASSPVPLIVAGAEDGRVHLWDINSRAQVGAFAAAGNNEPILALDCHPYEQAIVTGAGGAQSTAVRLWLSVVR